MIIYFSFNYYLLDSVDGILRLNVEGTDLLNNLNSVNKSVFIKNLKNGLANTVPMNPDRLNFNKYQMDYSTSPSILLLSFKILKPNNNEEISVAQAMDNLNTLIKNKDTTGISRNYYTNFIDEKYGFVFTSKRWTNMLLIL